MLKLHVFNVLHIIIDISQFMYLAFSYLFISHIQGTYQFSCSILPKDHVKYTFLYILVDIICYTLFCDLLIK